MHVKELLNQASAYNPSTVLQKVLRSGNVKVALKRRSGLVR